MVPPGSRQRAIPHTRWMDCVNRDTRAIGTTTGEVHDRTSWWRIVSVAATSQLSGRCEKKKKNKKKPLQFRFLEHPMEWIQTYPKESDKKRASFDDGVLPRPMCPCVVKQTPDKLTLSTTSVLYLIPVALSRETFSVYPNCWKWYRVKISSTSFVCNEPGTSILFWPPLLFMYCDTFRLAMTRVHALIFATDTDDWVLSQSHGWTTTADNVVNSMR